MIPISRPMLYVAGRIGSGVAVDYALALGLETIRQRKALTGQLREGLAASPGARLHDTGKVHCGIVSFTLNDEEPAATQQRLRARNITCSVSGAAYTRFDMDKRGLANVIRASVHYYNTDDEVDRLCAALKKGETVILDKLKRRHG